MEVRPGYKQTEVGVIPEEWNAKPLHFILTKGRLGGNYPNQDAECEFPLMKMGNIARGYFDMSKVEFITPGVTPEDQHRLAYGDVLFNTRNTLELVGKVAIWRDELPVAYYNSNLMRLELDASEVCSNEYANYTLNTAGSVARLRALATGTTSVAAIYTRDLMGFLFIVPPTPEQRAIAAALSDVDALLDGLDRFIAKKRDLKQAAMQQLLTGQTRLPGFRGEWKEKRLGDDVTLLSGHHVLARYCNTTSDGVPYLTGPADFPDGRIRHTKYTARPSTICAPHDILVTVKGSGSGTIALADAAYCISRQLMAIRVAEWDVRFVYCSLLQNADHFRAATTGLIPGLSRSDLLDQLLPIPPTVPEQTAIAAVLSDMDAELRVLEVRRTKTRDLKQAMMQELLTGRTRLV